MNETALSARLTELARWGAGEHGIDRGLFTEAEYQARRTFAAWARGAGLRVEQDVVGNLFARRPGRRDGPAILIGSHLDTVRTGGAYDGAYGVVGALCAIEELASNGTQTEFALEAVAWAGEEGSRFPMGCLGSGVYAGLNSLEDVFALIGDDGTSFVVARDGAHGLLSDVPRRKAFPRPAAYLELHIEQGPVLEREGARLGIVTAIAGQCRLQVEIVGEAGHAGTMPMQGRRDALCAAAEIVLALEEAARTLENCVATVGYHCVEPNQTNIVPGKVTLRVDVRSVDAGRLAQLEMALAEACSRVERRRGVATRCTGLESRGVAPMDERLRRVLHEAIAPLGVPSIDIASGAGHDAMCMASIVPTAMLFVPSAGGLSHVGKEYTAPADLEVGVAALTRSIVAVDRTLRERT